MVGGRLGKARQRVLIGHPCSLSPAFSPHSRISFSFPFSLHLSFLLLSFCCYCDNHLHKESRNYGRQLPQTVYPDLTAGGELRRAGSVRGLRLKPELFMRYCAHIRVSSGICDTAIIRSVDNENRCT